MKKTGIFVSQNTFYHRLDGSTDLSHIPALMICNKPNK